VHTIAENLTELLDRYEADDGNPPPAAKRFDRQGRAERFP
jgi:hypothetical protein